MTKQALHMSADGVGINSTRRKQPDTQAKFIQEHSTDYKQTKQTSGMTMISHNPEAMVYEAAFYRNQHQPSKIPLADLN
jgi:hypothetical protein